MPATSPDGFPYPEAESAANVPVDLKALADKIQSKYGAISLSNLSVPGGEGDDGKIAIVENGVIKLKAVTGDATITEAGDFQLGSKVVGTGELADKGVTTAKVDDGAVTSSKVKLTSGIVAASNALSLTGSYQTPSDLFLEITPSVASVVTLFGVYCMQEAVSGGGEIEAGFKLDAGAEAGISSGPGSVRSQGFIFHQFALTAAAHKIEMRIKKQSGEKGSTFLGQTKFLYALWGN